MQEAKANKKEISTVKFTIAKSDAAAIRETVSIKSEIHMLKKKLTESYNNWIDSLQGTKLDLRSKLQSLKVESNLI